jgi:hypothetical protein
MRSREFLSITRPAFRRLLIVINGDDIGRRISVYCPTWRLPSAVFAALATSGLNRIRRCRPDLIPRNIRFVILDGDHVWSAARFRAKTYERI